MINVGKTLHHLQQIDLEIRNNNKRLQEIARQLANHAPVKRAQARVAHAESALKPLQTSLRDLELQVQTTKQKHDASVARLYSGAVSNPKELQDIEQNIASLKRRQAELEDQQLEFMLSVEDAQSTLDQAQSALEKVTQEAAASNLDLLSEKEALESGIEDRTKERTQVSDTLDDTTLELYQDMSPKMAYRPIAQLTDDRMCSICGVQQTSLHSQTIKQSDDLMRCASCNRILIAT